MFLKRTHRNNLKTLQSISEGRRALKFPIRTGIPLGPRHKTCQWLHGEPEQRDFCAAPVKADSSYCETHHARCYLKPKTELTEDSGT